MTSGEMNTWIGEKMIDLKVSDNWGALADHGMIIILSSITMVVAHAPLGQTNRTFFGSLKF